MKTSLKFYCTFLLALLNAFSFGQNYSVSEFNYANGICPGCTVNQPQDAVGHNDQDYSTLLLTTTDSGAQITQVLHFPIVAEPGDMITLLVESEGMGLMDSTMIASLRISTSLAGNTNADTISVMPNMMTNYGVNDMQLIQYNTINQFDELCITLQAGYPGAVEKIRIYLAYFNKTLPLNLVYFNASPGDRNVTLEWGCTGNEGINQFRIEKSTDGNSFSEIAKLNSSGNDPMPNFTYVDESVAEPNNLYRLSATDPNGNVLFQDQVSVEVEFGEEFYDQSIYPNPFADEVTIEFVSSSDHDGILEITNLYGEVLRSVDVSITKGFNQWLVQDLGHYDTGLLYFTIQTASGSLVLKALKSN